MSSWLSRRLRRSRTGLPLLTRIQAGVTALAVMAAASACGNPASTTPVTSPTPKPSAGTTPTPAARQLFAVLEARHCQRPEPSTCEHPGQPLHDTAAIAGLDGFAVAKTTFSPRSNVEDWGFSGVFAGTLQTS